MKSIFDNYWKRWTLSCAAGELLGIGAAAAIAVIFNTMFGEPQSFFPKLLNLLVMVGGGVIEGTLLGWFQWRVLKEKYARMPKREWIGYTQFVAALGWFLGMLIPLFLVDTSSSAGQEMSEPAPLLFISMVIAMGLVLGAMFGFFQWIVFRKYARNAHYWILANMLGWGLGLSWIYLAASLPDENTSWFIIVVLGVFGGILAGLSVGAVTGIFLKKLNPSES